MGSFDGAETCELVGLYMLNLLKKLNLNQGLYRDDALIACSLRPRQLEMKKKEICRIFNENKLSISIQANLKIVNFLDVTLDLNGGCFKPYVKPNNKIQYINKDSNHPPSILKNIPAAVNRRLSSISSNKAIFNAARPPYQEALATSGYTHKLKFEPPANHGRSKRNRGRKILYFNPPYSSNVATKIGAKFLQIIDTCFPPTNPLHKIINRNTVKISYRTMSNMKQVISMHNTKVGQQQENNPPPGCNCRGGRATCPLDGACLTPGVVYEAKVIRRDNRKAEFYTGVTVGPFKTRYYGHSHDLRTPSQRRSTCLSKFVWELKDNGVAYDIYWKIIARGRGFNPTTRSCQACLKEKYYIMFRPEGATLNDKTEFYNTCRHRKTLLLENT